MATIPLTPTGGGGMCIAATALQPADIIVSTTTATVSRAIRLGTGAVVSHAMLYLGGGEVIEAISAGVVKRQLTEALAHASLGVSYRHGGINAVDAEAIIRYARRHVGREYDTPGAMLGGGGRANRLVCIVALGIVACEIARSGGFSSRDKFFCSELVLEAFRQANRPLITGSSDTSNPNNIVEAYSNGILQYVGHLVA